MIRVDTADNSFAGEEGSFFASNRMRYNDVEDVNAARLKERPSMRHAQTVILALCGIFVLWFTAAAFLNRPSRETAAVYELVVVSPHWEGIRYEFGRAFAERWLKEHPDEPVKLVWRDVGGTSQIIRYVESQFQATPEGIGVDVVFGGGTTPYEKLKDQGYLEVFTPPLHILNEIPSHLAGIPLYDPERYYFGAAISGFGIVYNKSVLDYLDLPYPETWEDLANPRYMDWVASGDPTKSGSVHMLYEIILQAYGFEKGYATICGMAGNVRAFDEGGNATPRAVGLGDAALGGAIDFYAWEQVAAHGESRIGFVMPRGLTVVNADPIAILKGAPNREVAGAFLRFVLSEEGQKLWYVKKGSPGGPQIYGLNRFPVMEKLYGMGLPTAVTGNPFDFKPGFTYNVYKGSHRWRVLNDFIRATIMDVHGPLRDAWRLAGPSGDEDLCRDFGKPPVDEETLMNMASGPWNSPVTRAKYISEWTRAAEHKFRAMCK